MGHGRPYLPLEKALKQRLKLEHRHTCQAYRVCVEFALDYPAIVVPMR